MRKSSETVAENKGKISRKVLISLAPMQIHTSEVTKVTPVQLQQVGRIEDQSWRKRMTDLINYLNGGVCRTAPATHGLLIRQNTEYDGKVRPRPFFCIT